jgi:hypothetical protein
VVAVDVSPGGDETVRPPVIVANFGKVEIR